MAAARPFALQREARDVLIAARVRSLSDCTQVVPGVNAGNRPVCPEAQGACASYTEPCAGGGSTLHFLLRTTDLPHLLFDWITFFLHFLFGKPLTSRLCTPSPCARMYLLRQMQ